MSVNIPGLAKGNTPTVTTTNPDPLFYNYRYDQLNRIVSMTAYKGLSAATNQWTATPPLNDYAETVSYDPNGNIINYTRNGSPTIAGKAQAMDALTYHYKPENNQLRHVKDALDSPTERAAYTEDIDSQGDDNYTYDAIGNLISDTKEGISEIKWTVYGKIASITKSNGMQIDYTYDADGNRISKRVANPPSGVGGLTVYVRDAGGNVMSVYERQGTGAVIQSELHLYGSSRLGILTAQTAAPQLLNTNGNVNDKAYLHTFTRGEKLFELSNHLGNVLTTITDKRIQKTNCPPCEGSNCPLCESLVDWYEADVVSAQDYYPGGMLMPGRKCQSSGNAPYRYGAANGQEKSTEINENSYTAEFWQYDARIARRWNVDPVVKIYESPYSAFGNNPIWLVDRNGADTVPVFRGNSAALNTDLKNKNISSWLDLLNFTPSTQLINLMKNRTGLRHASVQQIGRAVNDPTNFDYYSLTISKLPKGQDLKEFFEYLRVNFGDYITGTTSFAGFNSKERKAWNSSTPLGAVMSFDESFSPGQIVGDDASVLTSAYYSDVNGGYWNFTTLSTSWGDWGHPVSGTRQFGIVANSSSNGALTYTLFIRGVDRVSDNFTKIAGILSSETVFDMAHKTWMSVMTNINNYINVNGGYSSINKYVSQRLSWDKDVKSQYTVPTPCYICGKDHNK